MSSGTGGTDSNASPERKSSRDEGDFMQEMRDNYDRARQREHENIIEAYLDLGFRCGDAQWDATALNERQSERRPCMVVNLLPQFIRQVTGDIRQMRPAIKVVPVDDKADPKTADILSNLIRYIENRSDAQDAYYKAADQQVTAGVGHFRILREYYSEASFDQEIRVAPIEDGISVLWDPDAILPTREDANFCFVPVDMSRKTFEEKYPGKTADDMNTHDYQWRTEWATDDHVRVSEYWLKKPVKRTLAMLPDGSVIDVDKIEGEAEKTAILAQAKIQKRDGHKVVRYLVSLTDVLEDAQDSPGRFIPIVPVYGEEVRIGRRLVRHGMVRFMRDPQRIYNYYASAETEIVALQPKAPFIATENNFADPAIQQMWQEANLKNFPYLIYRPDPMNGGKSPERSTPPLSSQGILEGLKRAEEDMYRVTGIYPSALGKPSNETSGRAISFRQREGDTGTFVYIDNFARSIKHCGRVLVDMIPYVYDTQRTVRILGEDGEIDEAKLNQPQLDWQMNGLQEMTPIKRIENDVTVGQYDVVTQVGPSYTTRREEAKEGMIQLMQTAPGMAPVMMDLVAKAQDWPMADTIAERLHLLMPPMVQIADMLRKKGVPDDKIEEMILQQSMQQQQKPDPEQQAKADAINQKTQQDQQKHQADMQMKVEKHQIDTRVEAMQMMHDESMAKMQAQTEMILANLKIIAAQVDIAAKEQAMQHKAQAEQKKNSGGDKASENY